MKGTRIIVLGIALGAGGIAAYMVGSGRHSAPRPAPPRKPLATVEVLVAKANLDTGQVLNERDIGWASWPADAANPAFVKKSADPEAVKQYVGAIVRTPMVSGEPIRDAKVVRAKGSGFMAAILSKGMRAVSLDVAPSTDAGGFILPNDHVDILLTHRDKSTVQTPGGDKYVTDTILRNVRVLAVDQTVGEKNGEKVVIGKTATVELTPGQTETLALAKQNGSLSLALRSLLDSQSGIPVGGENEDGDHRTINTVRYGVSTQATSR